MSPTVTGPQYSNQWENRQYSTMNGLIKMNPAEVVEVFLHGRSAGLPGKRVIKATSANAGLSTCIAYLSIHLPLVYQFFLLHKICFSDRLALYKGRNMAGTEFSGVESSKLFA